MSVVGLLRQLAERSHVEVELLDAESSGLDEIAHALRETAEQAGLELAGAPPEFHPAAAAWAGRMLYRLCQSLAHGQAGIAMIGDGMNEACPDRPSPGVCWSVDLSFRFLPDAYRLARCVDPEHPLLRRLQDLGQGWPLSSVGMAGVAAADVRPFWNHPGLRQLYVDRILERGDAERLADPAVRHAVRTTVGGHLELAGELAFQLQETACT